MWSKGEPRTYAIAPVDPYFRDTWIHDRWTEQTCPVLRLDFLKFGVSDYDGFAARFIGEIRSFAKRLGL